MLNVKNINLFKSKGCVTRHINCHLRQMLCHSHEFHGLTLRLNFSPIFHNVLPKAPSNFFSSNKILLGYCFIKKAPEYFIFIKIF